MDRPRVSGAGLKAPIFFKSSPDGFNTQPRSNATVPRCHIDSGNTGFQEMSLREGGEKNHHQHYCTPKGNPTNIFPSVGLQPVSSVRSAYQQMLSTWRATLGTPKIGWRAPTGTLFLPRGLFKNCWAAQPLGICIQQIHS